MRLMTLMVTEQNHEEDLHAAFIVFAKTEGGSKSKINEDFFPLKDLEESFHAVSEKMSKRDIRAILRRADPNNDGLVSRKGKKQTSSVKDVLTF